MRKRISLLSRQGWDAAAQVRGPPNSPRPRISGSGPSTHNTHNRTRRGSPTRKEKHPRNLSASSLPNCGDPEPRSPFASLGTACGPGSRARRREALPGEPAASAAPRSPARAGAGPVPARGRRSPSGRVAPGRLGPRAPRRSSDRRDRRARGGKYKGGRPGRGGRAGGQPGRREEGWVAAGGSGEPDARSPPAPATSARPPPTKDPRFPSDRGRRARQQRASRAALPGRQGLSDLVSPKFMVWFQSKARGGGILRDRGEISQTRRENAQLRPGSVRAGLGFFLGESLEAGARQPNPKERRLRGGRAPATRAHPARPRPGGRPAGGREGAPGPRSPSCLLAATAARGAGGASRGVPGEAERSGLSRGLSARS